MDNRNVVKQKPVKNSLLQSATYGFPLENMLSNNLIVPVSQADSTLPENSEIDSFIGQDSRSPPQTPAVLSNLIVNENSKPTVVEQSVPLVVPSSSNPHAELPTNDLPTAVHLFGSNVSDSEHSFPLDSHFESSLPANRDVFSPTSYAQSANFSDTSFFTAESAYVNLDQSFPGSEHPSPRIPQIPPQGPSNSFRLGNLRKPTYAPVPGLSSTNSNRADPTLVAPALIPPNSTQQNFTTMSTPPNNDGTGSHSSGTTEKERVSVSFSPSPVSAERNSMYRPVYHHWFYRKDVDNDLKCVWKPFSMADSLALEKAFSLPTLNEETVVATDGSRYDVNIKKRQRIAIYWEEEKSVVRRCSWFSKGTADVCFTPYEEEIAAQLEEEYKIGMMTGVWNRKVEIGVGKEEVVMHSPSMISHQVKSYDLTVEALTDASIKFKPVRRRSRIKKWIRNSYNEQWANLTNQPSQLKPRLVKRGGFDDFDIDDGEPEKVDHLLFLVHGIGQFCDLKFRTIVEVVDEFRSISLQLTQSHFQESCELGDVNRMEILPVSWHKALHSEGTGVDQRLKNITLPSIPRMRDFSNDTILDVLFYTSPVFCQVIINAVASEMNRLHNIFLKRNPSFVGKVSVGGHSLGSLIMFDLLSNQPTPSKPAPSEDDIADELAEEYDKRLTTVSRRISVVTVGKAGTGQPLVKYPRLNFHPRFFFAFGSPIACFVATRSNEILGEDFQFPTCQGFFNIFHPYDPIAYRIEPLIIPSLSTVKPVQVSHHKGRKRMHLELKDTVSHVGQKLVDTVKNTWNMMYHLAVNKSVDAAESVIQQELSQVLQSTERLSQKPVSTVPSEPVTEFTNVKVGCLNEGRRIDYVLQEAPVEYFNEYLFALASHLCYWTSRDTMLLVLKEIYGEMGVYTDNQLPQTILPFDITDGEVNTAQNVQHTDGEVETAQNVQQIGVDPTQPMNACTNLGPPPMSGFVGKK